MNVLVEVSLHATDGCTHGSVRLQRQLGARKLVEPVSKLCASLALMNETAQERDLLSTMITGVSRQSCSLVPLQECQRTFEEGRFSNVIVGMLENFLSLARLQR